MNELIRNSTWRVSICCGMDEKAYKELIEIKLVRGLVEGFL